MFNKPSVFFVFALSCLLGIDALVAAESGPRSQSTENPSASKAAPVPTPPPATPTPVATDPGYRLAPGDTISIVVQNESELATTQTLSRISGEIRLELITGDVPLAGKSVREAEAALEALYRDRKLLKRPVIRVTVVGYTRREVSVNGAVGRPGPVAFPPGDVSMDVVDAIVNAGGFIPISKADAVKIMRRLPDGNEAPAETVDLDDVMSGKNKSGRSRSKTTVSPGDRIFVPDKIF